MAFNKTLIIVLVSLSSILLHAHAASTPQARVSRICKDVTNYTLCYQTVLPGVERLQKFTIYKVIEIEILETQKQVQTVLKVMNSLKAKPGTSKDMSDSLSVCLDQYDSILTTVEKSLKFVEQRNVGETVMEISSVISFYEACNDQFDENVTSPIATEAKVVYDLGSNCLDILKVIEDREISRQGANTTMEPPTGPPTPASPCQNTIGFCS